MRYGTVHWLGTARVGTSWLDRGDGGRLELELAVQYMRTALKAT